MAAVQPDTLLAHDVVGQGPHRVLFLHGILGSRSNWKGFARQLVDQCPQWSAVLADLRNHGDSHGQQEPHDIAACASDVQALASARGPHQVVVGHSFGGKVALAFALAHPASLDEVWLLDSPPGRRSFHEPGAEEILRVFDAVRSVPIPIESRRALVDALRACGLSEPIAQWMTTNLRPVDGGFGWRFDIRAAREMLTAFGALDLWPALHAHVAPPRIVVVRGGRSDRWSAEERAHLERSVAAAVLTEHVLEGAGHWVHTDDPRGLLDLLAPALRRLEDHRVHG